MLEAALAARKKARLAHDQERFQKNEQRGLSFGLFNLKIPHRTQAGLTRLDYIFLFVIFLFG